MLHTSDKTQPRVHACVGSFAHSDVYGLRNPPRAAADLHISAARDSNAGRDRRLAPRIERRASLAAAVEWIVHHATAADQVKLFRWDQRQQLVDAHLAFIRNATITWVHEHSSRELASRANARLDACHHTTRRYRQTVGMPIREACHRATMAYAFFTACPPKPARICASSFAA